MPRVKRQIAPGMFNWVEVPEQVIVEKPAKEKQPLAITTPQQKPRCIHFGFDTGMKTECKSCKGKVELKLFRCAVYDLCTPEKPVPSIACCRGCTHYTDSQIPKPEKILSVNLPKHYNCGIIEWKGKTLMVSRLGFAGAQTFLSELNDEYQPVWSRDLGIRHPRALNGAEDPRIFEHNGQLHVAVTGYETIHNGRTSQLLASLDDKLNVEKVWAPKYTKRLSWEKNWSPFVYEGELHFVYTISPHVILRRVDDSAIEVSRTTHNFSWVGTALRGGAPPVKIGAEYYSWFHSFTTDKRGKAIYGLGLYTFAAKPPFQLLRRVSSVILESNDEIPGWNKSVVFPCGAMLREGKWIISYGHEDRECRIAFFDYKEIEAVLK